tara:strand:+ start:47861 stop:48337 length:477 start_codon:yes stop_codon:yes gene_type:complete
MAISRARRNFRILLGVLLLFSFSFFSVSAYFYTSVKQRKISLRSIAPTLFQIDVYHYYALSYLKDTDGKFTIASKVYGKGIFNPIYTRAGGDMMQNLADDGYAPSQVFLADILMIYGDTQEHQTKAFQYYKDAASQGYAPAIEKLALLESIPPPQASP